MISPVFLFEKEKKCLCTKCAEIKKIFKTFGFLHSFIPPLPPFNESLLNNPKFTSYTHTKNSLLTLSTLGGVYVKGEGGDEPGGLWAPQKGDWGERGFPAHMYLVVKSPRACLLTSQVGVMISVSTRS